jgi:hypothetical protein
MYFLLLVVESKFITVDDEFIGLFKIYLFRVLLGYGFDCIVNIRRYYKTSNGIFGVKVLLRTKTEPGMPELGHFGLNLSVIYKSLKFYNYGNTKRNY